MFRDLHTLLNSQDWYNISLEIEILKGLAEKPSTIFGNIKKIKRISKFKQ